MDSNGQKVSDLLTDETRWTKGTYARDKEGIPVDERDNTATCWCLTGAIWKCYGTRQDNIRNWVYSKRSDINNISSWNDAPERTFEEVRALIIELDI